VSPRADIVVLNTESRAKEPDESAQCVKEAILTHPASLIYKKIDSTLRGNIGAEIEAALTASGAKLAIVVPAIPAAGRVTRDGQCYVNHIPLLETEFARDPKTPISSSAISTIIAQQTSLPIYNLFLDTVRHKTLSAELLNLADKGVGIV